MQDDMQTLKPTKFQATGKIDEVPGSSADHSVDGAVSHSDASTPTPEQLRSELEVEVHSGV